MRSRASSRFWRLYRELPPEIQRLRYKMDIKDPAILVSPWTEHQKALLGTEADPVIAKKLGWSVKAVKHMRALLNIPSRFHRNIATRNPT